MERVPVVVVGAGPTGACAALLLGRRGVDTLLLDRSAEVYPLPRAVHFDDEVFRVLAGLGLEDDVRALSRPAPGMRLTDARQRVLAEFRRHPDGVHGFPQANLFDQPDLERALRRAVRRCPAVRLRGGVEVHDVAQPPGGPGPVRVRYRHTSTGAEHEVWADAVLGCDGARGGVRAAIGATLEDLRFTQRWLVVDVTTAGPLDVPDGVQQVCDAGRAATFLPVAPGRYRWEFRLGPGERADDLPERRVLDLVRPWLGATDPASLTVLRRTGYEFRGVVADRWRDRRVFLLGDAAHRTPPFIGQGLGAGVRDAANLAWKLALVLDGRAEDRLLDTYEAERRPAARRLVRLAILVGALMTGGPARLDRARNAMIRALSGVLAAVDAGTPRRLSAYDHGPLVRAGRRPAGDLFGRPTVGGVPLDDLADDGWVLVHRGPGGVAPDPGTRAFFAALGTTAVRVGAADTAALAELRRHRAGAALVRPDRVVAAAADRPDLRAWRRRLVTAGITPAATASTPGARPAR